MPASRPRPTHLAVALALFVGGCSGDRGGAVVLRWQLIDQTTGIQPTICKERTSGGCCAQIEVSAGRRDVCIDSMRLLLTSPGTGTIFECPSCRFGCNGYEHTSNFEIPPGQWSIALRARRTGKNGVEEGVGFTPPAVVREIVVGAVVNLKSVEVVLPPDSPACTE